MTYPIPAFDQFTDVTRRSQRAAVDATEGWVRALRTYAEKVAPSAAHPVDPQTAAAAAFDLAERLLGVQRTYVATTLTLLSEVGETAGTQATRAGEAFKAQTEEAAERVIDLATETTRRAATAARNGASV